MFDWITGFVEQSGYPGIALLMFLENVFPPIPSELIMPLAGFTAAQGQLNVVLVIVAGTIGAMAGALMWYYAGRMLGADRVRSLAERHGRWMTITPAEVDQASDWFRRHGANAVFFGRLAPAVRTLISVPAGIAGMSLPKFLLYTGAGSALWTALLTGAGYLLRDQYQRVAGWVDPVSTGIVVLLVAWYVYRVVTFNSRQHPKESRH
ncbi:DedA family protein [Azospirillum sp. SYSU D00513]|uniref:DedA family protein n=1 Tax=Azospirillum sp. SYSU D00513 TaxID=2812561 RepID=UPI001A958BFC|nr:DedA family protein [Azospirillum sp. SYSU D00513]